MKIEILKLIAKHDGKLSWYELDRTLIYQGVHPSLLSGIMPTLKQLEQSGLVTAEGQGRQPRYQVTEAGRQFLKEQEIAA